LTRIIEIPGKHGLIRLVVPDNKPTQEELDDLHMTVAVSIYNTWLRNKNEAIRRKLNVESMAEGS
jgi:hypothetical protein